MIYSPLIEWVNKLLDKFIAGIKEAFATPRSTLGAFAGTVMGLAVVYFAMEVLGGWKGELFLLGVICFALWMLRSLKKKNKGED